MYSLLAMVRAFSGSMEGRIRIQKSAYLLKLLGAREFADLRFRYHHYGPYCRELSADLHQAVTSGGLREEEEPVRPDATRYVYKLTEDGNCWLNGFESDVESQFEREVAVLRSANLKTLELAATIAYLERDERLDRLKASARAVELKPKCADVRQPALDLLRELGVAEAHP